MIWAVLLGLGLQVPALPPVPPVTLSAVWTSVLLPAAPLGIAAHNGTLWVCGADEMVAESSDGGRTWTLRNLHRKGEMLFSISFPSPQRIAIFGSGGIWVESTDSGTTWQRRKYLSDIRLGKVAFVNDQIGFGIGFYRFGTTSDGGTHWQAHLLPAGPAYKLPDWPGKIQDYEAMGGLAALDQNHAVVLAARGRSQSLVTTSDGGRTWIEKPVPGPWTWHGLRADGMRFHLDGTYQAPGADPIPAASESADGLAWKMDTPPPINYPDCKAQGTFDEGGCVDLSGAVPRYRTLPKDNIDPTNGPWAVAGGSFCRVAASLRCRTEPEPLLALPPALPAKDSIVAPRQLYSPDPEFPGRELGRMKLATVVVQVVIGEDGGVHTALVLYAPAADFAREAIKAVNRWRFQPATKDGRPLVFVANIEVNFRQD